MRWFRMYSEVMHDPKVQKLPAELFRFWVNCLALASENNGYLPSVQDIAWTLRRGEKGIAAMVAELHDAELLDREADTFSPHNWNIRQYKSDTSTPRVKKLRDKRNVSCNVSGTPHVTDQNRADTDTEAEAEKPSSAAGAAAEPESPTLFVVEPEKATTAWLHEQHDRWYLGAFWNRKDREGSRKAYCKQIKLLMEKGMTREQAAAFLWNEAIADQKRFRGTPDWEWRQNLHPATWLNGQRWEDQPRARESPLSSPRLDPVAIAKKRAEEMRRDGIR